MLWFRKKIDLPDHLNICLIANKFPILGRSADHGFLWPIARGLAERGHNVTVIAWRNPQGKDRIQQDGVTAYFLGNHGSPLKEFPEEVRIKFLELHEETPFHIVHSVDFSGFRIGLRKKVYDVAMCYDVEATQMAKIFNVLAMAQDTLAEIIHTALSVVSVFLYTYYSRDRKLLKTADGIFVTSPLQKVILERYYLFPEYRTYLVPYGIAIGELKPRSISEELRDQLNLPKNARTVVTITDMTELEEIKNLLKAFEKLAIKKNSARLIILGDGPLKNEIEFEMLNMALGSRVIFAGNIPNNQLADYIALSDVFVNLSSRSTGFEPTLLVAMAQKKVIIGSEVSPMSTIVDDGEDGFLVRPADFITISNLLIQIFEEHLPTEEIGERAHTKVTELFDTHKMVDNTITAYYQTLVRTGNYRSSELLTSPSLA
ncbi:MAG: glycosyltransferase family 4 protein [Bdellovibrionales bacterium]|nr:glycosyltransferase family 4 protein [Bdellovibrionales bacterium]